MKKGFTLIETLVAISILTLSVSGPLYTASRALVAVEMSRYQLTASYLAQEGVEYVRMMRDNEFLAVYKAGGTSATAWTNFITAVTPCSSPNICALDPVMPSLQACSGGTCSPLYLANGVYTQQNGWAGAVVTPYTRTIQVAAATVSDEKIVSTVSWTFHGKPYSVVISDHLTPWQ